MRLKIVLRKISNCCKATNLVRFYFEKLYIQDTAYITLTTTIQQDSTDSSFEDVLEKQVLCRISGVQNKERGIQEWNYQNYIML